MFAISDTLLPSQRLFAVWQSQDVPKLEKVSKNGTVRPPRPQVSDIAADPCGPVKSRATPDQQSLAWSDGAALRLIELVFAKTRSSLVPTNYQNAARIFATETIAALTSA
jgi:hypothetical protein